MTHNQLLHLYTDFKVLNCTVKLNITLVSTGLFLRPLTKTAAFSGLSGSND